VNAAFKTERLRSRVWRAVEAQHRIATMKLVDNSLADQAILEKILEESKPPVPAEARGKHWLIFTPFRYTPPPPGSRFRAPHDPGVFYAAFERRTACAEIGYWLGEAYWGRGIATEAVGEITAYGFEHFDLIRIYAVIMEWNLASIRVIEKAGYQFEGRRRKAVTKDGQTIDDLLYAIIRDD